MHKDLITLKQITKPIIEDVKIFQREFENALNSEVRLINTISKYLIKNKGKNIRPILTIFFILFLLLKIAFVNSVLFVGNVLIYFGNNFFKFKK